jgi:hypothetical protein
MGNHRCHVGREFTFVLVVTHCAVGVGNTAATRLAGKDVRLLEEAVQARLRAEAIDNVRVLGLQMRVAGHHWTATHRVHGEYAWHETYLVIELSDRDARDLEQSSRVSATYRRCHQSPR